MVVNQWQVDNKEKYNAYKREWYKKNNERQKKYVRSYRKKNIEKARKQGRDQYYVHKEERKLARQLAKPVFKKNCVICGGKFETRLTKKVTCTDTCQRERNLRLIADYYKKNKAKLRGYKKQYARDHYGVKK